MLQNNQYRTCILCNNVFNLEWNTSQLITQAQCDAIGASWRPPDDMPYYEATPSTLGHCGAPLNVTCDQYFAFPSQFKESTGFSVDVQKPWISLGGGVNGTGSVYVNGCQVNQLGTISSNGSIDVITSDAGVLDFSSAESVASSCEAFGNLHDLEFCVEQVTFYPPVDISPTVTVIDTESGTTEPSSNWWWGIPITLIGGGATATWWFWPRRPPPPTPPPPKPRPKQPENQPTAPGMADKLLEAVYGIVKTVAIATGIVAAGALTAFVLVSISPITGTGLAIATVAVIIYNSDGTTDVIYVDVTVPMDGA